MNTITIPIDGMTCGGCVKSVERAIGNQPGVSRVKASLEQKNAVVDFDAAAINQSQLEQAIQKAGFTVRT